MFKSEFPLSELFTSLQLSPSFGSSALFSKPTHRKSCIYHRSARRLRGRRELVSLDTRREALCSWAIARKQEDGLRSCWMRWPLLKNNEKSVKSFNERLMCLDCHFQMILPFAVQNGGEGIERECGAAIPVVKWEVAAVWTTGAAAGVGRIRTRWNTADRFMRRTEERAMPGTTTRFCVTST